MNRLSKTFFLCTLLLLLTCPRQDAAHAEDKEHLNVFTSLAPVSFVVGEIGGDYITVHTLIPPGRDPHTFSPTPRQVVALSQADIYFTIDMPFETELMSRLAAGDSALQIVDCSVGVVKRHMDHDHDHHHQHRSAQGDPHIWLGIKPLAQMARNITATLSAKTPEYHQQFEKNLDHFITRLTRMESELTHLLSPFKGRSFLVFHPSFGYFADNFGLVQESVEIEGKSPSPRQVADIIKLARKQAIRVIFIQPQFDKRAAERIAQAIDGEVLTIDPLAANIFDNSQAMAAKIAATFGQ